MRESSRGTGMGPAQALTAAALVCTTLLMAACSSSSDGTQPATTAATTVAPSPTTALPTTPALSSAILASYRQYWAARVAAQAQPDKSLPADLTRYATGTAVSDVRATVLLFRKQGIEMRGQPSLTPSVTTTDTSSATIRDCVDSTDWLPVYAATGKSALAPGQAPRVVMTSTAILNGQRWVINSAVAERDRTC